ncbi:serine threonine protein kinase, CMGC group [Xylaria sp. FL1042]|nr:serine threonine protein kinase, CMGC group [Xylaria sp. FL1042]
MVSLLRRISWPFRSWKPIAFSNSNFPRISSDQRIEEETLPDYRASRYYPIYIGEVLRNRYQVVGKLGFGTPSTVWLARDLNGRRHLDKELNMYKRMKEKRSANHPSRTSIRELLDSFDVEGPDGQHRSFLRRNPVMRLPAPVLAVVLHHLFLALDFLQRECSIIHTDIKVDNIMFGIGDNSVFDDFEQQELRDPSPRKVLDDRIIYTSRELSMPKRWGIPVLCDFGSAVCGDEEHQEDVQPNVYRAPEVILQAPWTYMECRLYDSVWDLLEGGHLFTGHDPEFNAYRSRAHLSEMVALLGQPPQQLLSRGKLSSKFFSDKGDFCGGLSLPATISLEEIETNLEGQDKESYLRMMRMMLQWDPCLRSSARELAGNEWLQGHIGS